MSDKKKLTLGLVGFAFFAVLLALLVQIMIDLRYWASTQSDRLENTIERQVELCRRLQTSDLVLIDRKEKLILGCWVGDHGPEFRVRNARLYDLMKESGDE